MWLGLSLLYLEENIKPYTSYGLRAELENFAKKTFCPNFDWSSLILDRSSQAKSYYNFCSNSTPTLHKTHTLSKSKHDYKTCFNHSLPTIQIRVLIH